MTKIAGYYVDIPNRKTWKAEITFEAGKIVAIEPVTYEVPKHYLMAGFIDAHIHIESSMLIPSEFARLAVTHGTVATISDPHEIGNVLGVKGVEFMIENGKKVPFNFYFGAPSCVPATVFETAGAEITTEDVAYLLAKPEIKYLAEMMNWVGVIYNEPQVYAKLEVAKKAGKPIDGHAPGLRGEMAQKYISAGISTDHECFTKEEALDKLAYGMKIIIREGSAAKNYNALAPLITEHYENMMFCSDDKHPDELVLGHINQLVARAVAEGYDVFHVLQMACLNPIAHYNLEVGKLQVGDSADFIVVEDLEYFEVKQTYIKGQLVAEAGATFIPSVAEASLPNQFVARTITESELQIPARSSLLRVIKAIEGELVTKSLVLPAKIENGLVVSDVANDILKLVVVNRYQNAPVAHAFVKNFGFQEGAIASTVAHDSHNIIAVGVDDASICRAINLLMESKGGVSAVGKGEERLLPLPVAGLMASTDCYEVADGYSAVDAFAKRLGTPMRAPFMTLSFMALLVIPSIKLSDLGLFDGDNFDFVDIFYQS